MNERRQTPIGSALDALAGIGLLAAAVLVVGGLVLHWNTTQTGLLVGAVSFGLMLLVRLLRLG